MPENVWEAITPALLTTGGDLIVLSTPFGCQGEFYRIWINKDGAYGSFTRFSIDSEKVVSERAICETWTELQRTKALEKIEQAKKRMSKKVYSQEYMGHFIEDLHRWFSDALIEQTCVLKRRGGVSSKGEHYIGVDLARMGEDEISYSICDRRTEIIEQVEQIIETKKLTTETEDKIIQLANIWTPLKIYIDAGAGTLGVSILDHLLQHSAVKKLIVAINNAERVVEYDPDGNPKTAKLLKEDLYDSMRALMEQRKIRLLDDEDIKASLASIQYEYLMKEGEPTKLHISGNYAHIAESLIRMAHCIKERHKKFFIMGI